MDSQSAKNLVIDTFENGFDKAVFLNFIRNLVKKFDESKAFQAHGYIKEKFKKTTPIIKTYERLGTYTDQEEKTTDILIVYLNKDNSIEARSSLRNFVADYLKQRDSKDSALVAFVAPSNDDWRFSLIKMEYQLEKSDKGRLKAKTKLTPAKRFSFLVGKNENSYTAKKQFLPLLTNDQLPLLFEFEEAFNVEKVTKEFFAKYRQLYEKLQESLDILVKSEEKIRNDFKEKNIDTVDFAKKLLGQIVFLYFLQKKGWFGVDRNKDWGTGSKKFLRELFEGNHGSYKNFFNDVLEPLFYEALRNDRSYDKHYFSLFKCKIPFLNGGLFDPINDYDWTETDILLPNELFSNDHLTKEGDSGDGILDIFDRYNFTVKEDEPLEKEVAIDPEMLGKVFENLLEVKDRKSKGTYYTPREIVHYMCQQSLINYLATEFKNKVEQKSIEALIKYGETTVEHDKNLSEKEKTEEAFKLPKDIIKNAKEIDDKLADIRVCDPAVGSGAFLVGMMSEVVKARNALTSHLKNKQDRSLYDFKRQAIEKSLYGVDIDLGAVEIAKLRLWLSLIVDEENIKDIKPLPNLDYKIMQGNSLIEYVSPESLALTNEPDRTKLIRSFNQSKQEYLSTYDPGQKKVKRDQINKLIEEIMLYDKKRQIESDKLWKKYQEKQQANLFGEDNKQLAFGGLSEKEKEKLNQQIKEFNQLKSLSPIDHFEWHLNFNEVFDSKGGFDVLIANPPYIGESGNKEIFRPIAKGNLGNFYQGKMDLFYFFFHLALDLGKPYSLSAFISTNYFITASGAKKLRYDLRERALINNLVNFNELRIFESALGQHNMITIFSKDQNKEKLAHTCITRRSGVANEEILNEIVSNVDNDTKYFSVKQKHLYDGEENYIRLGGIGNTENPIEKVLEKIQEQGSILKNVCKINQGLVTGANKVSLQHIKKYKIKADVGDGIFIYDKGLLAEYGLEYGLIKPWFKNSDINRYTTNSNNIFELVLTNFIKNLSKYKKLEKRLNVFKEILCNRSQMEHCLDWWDLHQIRMKDKNKTGKIKKMIFDEAKIVAPYRSKTNTFGYNEIPWYAASDVYFITQKDKRISLKFILGLLNSKLYHLWLYQRGKKKGETLELFYQPLSEIPIKKIFEEEQKPFVELVDKILKITSTENYDPKNPPPEQKLLEAKIDQMVYKLYGLTPEEIEIVEK